MDDAVVDALGAQQDELAGVLDGLDEDGWARPSFCEGWSVSDVVLHLAQTNEMAVASCAGELDQLLTRWLHAIEASPASSVEDGAGALVTAERGAPGAEVGGRWRRSAAAQLDAFRSIDAATRVQWVAGDLAARSLCSTRLSEAWIHTGDVAVGLGVDVPPTDRIWHIARLAWRTLPYAFAGAGLDLHGAVTFELEAPDGSTWVFAPEDGTAATTIRGRALDLCLVAGQRRDAAATTLTGEGPDAADVLRLVRTFA